MAVFTNGTIATGSVPITSSVSTAPQTVVAALDVDCAEGNLVICSSKVEIQVTQVQNVAVCDFVRFVYNGAPDPLPGHHTIGRPMGENVTVSRKYRICVNPAVFVVPELPEGVTTITIEHVVYVASSAWQPAWAPATVMYCDQKAAVLHGSVLT